MSIMLSYASAKAKYILRLVRTMCRDVYSYTLASSTRSRKSLKCRQTGEYDPAVCPDISSTYEELTPLANCEPLEPVDCEPLEPVDCSLNCAELSPLASSKQLRMLYYCGDTYTDRQ